MMSTENIEHDSDISGADSDNTNQISTKLVGLTGGAHLPEIAKEHESSILNQLPESVKQQLSQHTWALASYSPPKFIIADENKHEIVDAQLKYTNKGSFNLVENNYLQYNKKIIGAIPIEIKKHKDPLGFSLDNLYSIKFQTNTMEIFEIKHKTIDEIVLELKNHALVYIENKASEILSIIINAFERDKRIIIDKEIHKDGFFYMSSDKDNKDDGKPIEIIVTNKQYRNPSTEEILKSIDTLENLQNKTKNKQVLPTVIRWTLVAPFNFIMKKKNKMWLPWLFLYGYPKTGKTTNGDISCAIWDHYSNKEFQISFTHVDTVAKMGEVLSKHTYPIVINEAGALSGDSRYGNTKNLIEMIKNAIEGITARSKFLHKTTYMEIPSLSPFIFTSNSSPPADLGFKRRIIAISFTPNDEYSDKEKKDFESLFYDVKHDLKVLGNFTASYILENQDLILDGKKDWKEVSIIVLQQMYQSVGKKLPSWFDDMVKEENLVEDSKEESELILRSSLIEKINSTYTKNAKNFGIQNDNTNIDLKSRLDFCVENQLIPYLHWNKERNIICITADFISEFSKTNNNHTITSLKQVAEMIDGFEYSQKKLGRKNLRCAWGPKSKFLEFLSLVYQGI